MIGVYENIKLNEYPSRKPGGGIRKAYRVGFINSFIYYGLSIS